MRRVVFFLIAIMGIPQLAQAAYTIKNGKLISMEEVATLSVQEHYGMVKEAIEQGNHLEVIKQARIVVRNFPDTPFAQDCHFYLGEAYFRLQEFDMAEENFSNYLKKQATPRFFEKAIEYKFLIAEQFQQGARKRMFGREGLPKWMSGKQEAIALFDEVVMALPQHDLAVKSLYGKAQVLFGEKDFKASIETFQTLLRRFPKHPLARDSYVSIANVYYQQVMEEYPDPDYLDLARINLKKFQLEFPHDPKIEEVKEVLGKMIDIYAQDLYKTAQFYERTKKPSAAVIYYSKILAKYPESHFVETAKACIGKYHPEYLEPQVPVSSAEKVIVDTAEGNQVDELR